LQSRRGCEIKAHRPIFDLPFQFVLTGFNTGIIILPILVSLYSEVFPQREAARETSYWVSFHPLKL